jgi:hypothetical protein
MNITGQNGEWFAVQGERILAGPFETNAAGFPEIERGGVTATRYFPGKLSQSRNANDPWRLTPDACHWCREAFAPGQMRYPVLTATCYGWEIASVCMECFKCGYDCSSTLRDSITKLERANTKCAGCGEPMHTVINAGKGRWNDCSNRCYQREYRKRRRGVQSVVDWKEENRKPRCEACKQPVNRSRCDARFCSNRCRQWHYRRRKSLGVHP